ncbi:type II toxin-antitoxin system RelE/ParE family toxin [Bacteroides sp. ET71]|uniref:type II toxin-antitoxin system RelE/ParE family toxin n=1 Tax=Bacteroides sp. ET71 TaxID=2939421 RepID=UPI0020118D9A|nr:type II toxin-antitoxin system RelE/ParE family toxin [Bacteroides sp. ET71]MCL1614986.1 type II toxin-antitoxin system RelE/ParE family toxin [Bacteroides sp. ET71]
MVKIKWDKLAKESLVEILRYGSLTWGKRVAKNMRLTIKETEKLLSTNPLMGKNEPELQGNKLQFRSLVIHEHYKLIYYYSTDKDILRIVDIWDTRMNPANLKQRVR